MPQKKIDTPLQHGYCTCHSLCQDGDLFAVLFAMAIVIFLSGGVAVADETMFPSAVKISQKGELEILNIKMVIDARNSSWAKASNPSWNVTDLVTEKDSFALKADFNKSGLVGKVDQKLTAVNSVMFDYSCAVNFTPPVQINGLFATMFVPLEGVNLAVDDEQITVADTYQKSTLYNDQAKLVRIKSGGLEVIVKGNFRLHVQDNRPWKQNRLALRFQFDVEPGMVKEGKINLRIQVNTIKNKGLDLSGVANSALVSGKFINKASGTDNDKAGFDLSKFDEKLFSVQGINFKIADTQINNGKSLCVTSASNLEGTVESFAVELGSEFGIAAKAINLLHAATSSGYSDSSLGEILVEYNDGTSQSIPVEYGRDCADWKLGNESVENASVAWYTGAPANQIGLYASSFALSKNNPSKIKFINKSKDRLWVIAGVNLSEKPITFITPQERDVMIVQNDKWLPVKFTKEVVKGSPLDFSWVQDAPAGKYGYLKSNNSGEFIFEDVPDKTIRLYGVNTCNSASFPDKKTADFLAEELARKGYNAIRIHHHDNEMLDNAAGDSVTFDNEMMDRLDYFAYVMKTHGLYITTDLYTSRKLRRGDNIPELKFISDKELASQHVLKMLLPISPATMDNWKVFVRKWLAHVNPYTGVAWGNEPAIFCLNLMNEDTLINNWSKVPAIARLYREAFKEWVKDKEFPAGDKDDRAFKSFIYELQAKANAQMMRFVKDELNVKAMLTSHNFITGNVALTALRNDFDLVDNHSYFDHPKLIGGWHLPQAFMQESAISLLAPTPAEMMPTRIFGKPFIATEFNFCQPNSYRAETGPLLGGYSSLQNWSGVFRFDWAHRDTDIMKLSAINGSFDATNDPLAQLSDRIAIALFVRGDVKPSEKKFSYTVNENIFKSNDLLYFPENFLTLGLISQIGSNLNNTAKEQGVTYLKPEQSTSPGSFTDKKISKLWKNAVADKKAVSSTGQLDLDGNRKQMVVTTPRSESITLARGNLSADFVSLANADSFQTVAVISLDRKPLRSSSSILIIHLTNLVNSRALFKGDQKRILQKPGSTPALLFRGTSELNLDTAAEYSITALAANGVSLGVFKGAVVDGKFSFKLDPGRFPGAVMAYHLTCKK